MGTPRFLSRSGYETRSPFWLKKSALVALASTFTLCNVALIILWYFGEREDGLGIIWASHYSWTYGPTAVLVILVGIWSQIDFCCKLYAPWQSMQNRYAAAKQSLLLDYISPVLPKGLWIAIKYRHFPVILSITGFLLLKLTVLASTGFLQASETLRLDNITVQMETKLRPYFQTNLELLNSTQTPWSNYQGILDQHLPYPVGSTNQAAFETFIAPHDNFEGSVSATVNLVHPIVDCGVANLAWGQFNNSPTNHNALAHEGDDDPNGDPPIDEPTAQLYHPDCPSTNISVKISEFSFPIRNPYNDGADGRERQGSLAAFYCDIDGLRAFYNAPSDDDTVGWTAMLNRYAQSRPTYILHYVTDISYNGTQAALTASNSTVIFINNISGVVCTLNYSTQTSTLTAVDGAFSLDTTYVSEISPGQAYANFNMSNLVYENLVNADGLGSLSLLERHNSTSTKETEGVLYNISFTLEGLAVQVALNTMLVPANEMTDATLRHRETRLHVRLISLWTMVSGFSGLLLITSFLYFRIPEQLPRIHAESILEIGTLLSDSTSLSSALESTGSCGDDTLTKRLSEFTFHLNFADGSPQVLVGKPDSRLAAGDSGHQTSLQVQQWWHPLMTRRVAIVLVLSLPLLLVGVLEYLQHLSDRSRGIGGEHELERYAWSYLPGLIILIVAATFESLDFTISTFAPFSSLRKGNSVLPSSLIGSTVRNMRPVALYQSVASRQYGAFFSAFATLLASFLPIFVSGLITLNELDQTTEIRLTRLDTFNMSHSALTYGGDANSLQDNNAARTFNRIQHENIPYPPWTYGEFAFPELEVGTGAKGNQSLQFGSLHAKIPAVRAVINCTVVPDNYIQVSCIDFPCSDLYISTTLDMPSSCPVTFGQMNLGYQFLNLPAFSNHSTLEQEAEIVVGVRSDLTGFYSLQEQDSRVRGAFELPETSIGCPSLGFLFGSIRLADIYTRNEFSQSGALPTVSGRLPNLTFAVCHLMIEEVQTQVKFSSPLDLDLLEAPLPDENSRVFIPNPLDDNKLAYDYDADVLITEYLAGYPIGANGDDVTNVDTFFQVLLHNNNETTPQEYLRQLNVADILDAASGLYKEYLAQLISLNLRQPLSTPDPSSPKGFFGTATFIAGQILRQNVGSKIALQVSLLVMFVCGVLAYLLTNMRQVLPHNPWTIAGMASLLVGGEIPKLAAKEDLRDSGKRRDVFQGRKFRMGFWDLESKGYRGGKRIFAIGLEPAPDP